MNWVRQIGPTGEYKYPLKAVKIAKCHGQSSLESRLIKGYALQMARVSQQMPLKIKGAKIACLDMNLNKFKMQMGIQFVVNDPKNLEKIRQRFYNFSHNKLNPPIENVMSSRKDAKSSSRLVLTLLSPLRLSMILPPNTLSKLVFSL